jgi:hypothetical protein
MFIMSTDPTKLSEAIPNLRSIFVCHLPFKVTGAGIVKFLKNGCWELGGECTNCADLGSVYFHCIRCDPLGFLYELETTTLHDIVSDDPRAEGQMAHIVHFEILDQRDPAAARLQFLLFFQNCSSDDTPIWNQIKPKTTKNEDDIETGHKKLRRAAHIMHSTIISQPNPCASRSHFLLLLDSVWAKDKPGTY